MQKPLHLWLGAALIFSLVAATTTQAAEWPVFEPVNYELLFDYDLSNRQIDQLGDDDQFFVDEYDLRAALRIEGRGYWLDPGILGFNYYLEPLYSTGEYSSLDFRDDRGGDSLSYSLGVDLLHGSRLPVQSSLLARQTSTTSFGAFGDRSESDLRLTTLLLQWDNGYFPLSFRFDDRDLLTISESSVGRPGFIRDDSEQVFTIKGTSSKTDLKYEHRSLDDRVVERNNDFDIDQLNLKHRFPWGSGSELTSRLTYYDRTGLNAVERLKFNGIAEIQHRNQFDSETKYEYRSLKRKFSSTSNSGSFRLRHSLYRNLTTSGFMRVEDIEADLFDESQLQTGVTFDYQKPDLFGAAISARVSAAYSINDNVSRAGFREIVDEPHRVPVTGGVILQHRFIAPESVIVTDASTSLVYVLGSDYEVLPIGNDLTQVFVIPGGRIETGDTILVSYNATILPSMEFSALDTTFGFNYRRGWFDFSYRESGTEYDLTSGMTAAFLSDRRDRTIALGMQWDSARTSNQFAIERLFFSNGPFEITTDTINQSTSLTLTPRLLMGLGLTGSHSESNLEVTDLYALNLNFTWRPTPSWTVRPTIGAWKRTAERLDEIDIANDEEILSASLNLRWSLRKLTLDLNLRHNDRTSDGDNYLDDNVYLSVRRRF